MPDENRSITYDAPGCLSRYRDTDSGFTWRNQAYDSQGHVTHDGVRGPCRGLLRLHSTRWVE